MTEIKIFVVKTELKRKKGNLSSLQKIELTVLNNLKEELIRKYGGLTEISNFKGYWNNNGEIWEDTGDLWLIYGSFSESTIINELIPILRQIRATTNQLSQAYAINNEIGFITN